MIVSTSMRKLTSKQLSDYSARFREYIDRHICQWPESTTTINALFSKFCNLEVRNCTVERENQLRSHLETTGLL